MIEAAFRIPSFHSSPRSPTPAVVVNAAVPSIFEKPDRDYQAAGIELRWRRDCTVTINDTGNIEGIEVHKTGAPYPEIEPVGDAYYSIKTEAHVVFPVGFQGLLLPIPRFFDAIPAATYDDSPAVVPRIVALDYWPRSLVLLCRRPRPNTYHNLYADEPYCHIIPVQRGEVAIRPMDSVEEEVWKDRESLVKDFGYDDFLTRVRKDGWFALRDALANPLNVGEQFDSSH